MTWLGRSLPRLEDERLLRGAGRFVGDISLPEGLEAVFVRSPHGRARLRSIRSEKAAHLPGVVGIFTHQDFPSGPMPPFLWDAPPADLVEAVQPYLVPCHPPLLPGDAIQYVGQAVAVVVAESRYLAEDAAEQVELDLEELGPISSMDAAMGVDAPVLHEGWKDNIAARVEVSHGDVTEAFGRAASVMSGRFATQRVAGVPLETRGALGRVDEAGHVVLWSSTQNAHPLRDALAKVAGIPSDQVRVIAPDVGGGFGIKGVLYAEDLLVGLLAMKLGRPVRWIEDRVEHMQSAIHAREQVHDIELALGEKGEILAVRDRFLVDSGAFNPLGIVIPYNTIAHLLGPYRVPAFQMEGTCVVTNKVPTAPYRGAGRPDAVFAMERILERAARSLDIDPLALRLQNLIKPEEMPFDRGMLYRDAQPLVLDGGDFPAALTRAAQMVDYERLRVGGEDGPRVGVGLACYVEGTGIGPFEGATVTVEDDRVTIHTGASSQGQGHATVLAQLCADHLGVAPERVVVVGGDTAGIDRGWGTVASRTAVVAGSAVAEAAHEAQRLLLDAAARHLEVAEADLRVEDGRISVVGTDLGVDLFELASVAARDGTRAAATSIYRPSTVTWASGVHAVAVRVEEETGRVEILNYAVVHDCGREINPMIVEGQVVGGVAQGIGQALYEEVVYDELCQLLTATFDTYLVPTSVETPSVAVASLVSPSPLNELGVKGVGEGGAVPPPAAIANAVEHAVGDLGAVIDRTPLSPSYLRGLWADSENQEEAGRLG